MTAKKTRTMYMHTLDDQPASIQRDPKLGVWLAFIGGRSKVQLAPSLNTIRCEWNECLEWLDVKYNAADELKRYGYVLVEVPA